MREKIYKQHDEKERHAGRRVTAEFKAALSVRLVQQIAHHCTERPPLRIQLGRDSFTAVADKLQFVAEEQQAWRDLSVSTDHDDVAAS